MLRKMLRKKQLIDYNSRILESQVLDMSGFKNVSLFLVNWDGLIWHYMLLALPKWILEKYLQSFFLQNRELCFIFSSGD